jgi:hypothetical protein
MSEPVDSADGDELEIEALASILVGEQEEAAIVPGAGP